MKNISSKLAARWLHLAMLVLVLAGLGNIYSHLCLDGQEPQVSVHFENFSNHEAHDEGSYVADVERESIPDGLLVKSPNQDDQLFVLAVSLLLELQAPEHAHHVLVTDFIVPHAPFEVLPPTRAPPVHSS